MFNKTIGNRKKLHISIIFCVVLFILIVAVDNFLYNKSESFNIYESYTLSPTIATSEISSSILYDPTTIIIDGIVTKKVNPMIIKKGFFLYSYCYVFNGYISVGDYVFHYDDNTQFISTYLTLDNETVLFASPVQTDIMKIDGNVYKYRITVIHDTDYNLLKFSLTLNDTENHQKANYIYDF